ncbi:MAG: N-(5'-phosphoribosyl)anthranilate isomerase [Acidobacteria bacterium]|nr:MAG: N-(5'-phosphoribosyl)anthranilate isomerase [Acidobacteriota bacterium]
MEPSRFPRVKVCCIQSVAEARAAIRAGASAVGLVSDMPSGPGVIPEDTIAVIAAAVPPPVSAFLLTCRRDAASIAAQQRRLGVGTLQLCDRLAGGAHADLRAALPGVRLVQVVHVTGPEAVDEAAAVAPLVDAVLLDSGNPGLPVKELGGTGRRHDWSLSRRIREALGVPVFLAGGLTADNVGEAIAAVGPFALDVCGGVRTSGALDETRLEAFFRAAGPAA